ncbi:MAG: hypothetical protein AAB569_05235 [Patescibacteria group bacterium]
MSEEMARNVKCFNLEKLDKNHAIFFKTGDNCYFVTYFVPIVTLFTPNAIALIIKDFSGNKFQKGKKACFGKTIESYVQDIKVGECFSYVSAKGAVTTRTVDEIVVGYFKDVERHFLETIKERLQTKGCSEAKALTLAS